MKPISDLIEQLEKAKKLDKGGMGSGRKPGQVDTHFVEENEKQKVNKPLDLAKEMAEKKTDNIFELIRRKKEAGENGKALFRSFDDFVVDEIQKAMPKPPKAGAPIRPKKDPAVQKKIHDQQKKQIAEAR